MLETWDFLHNSANSAAFNMALDESLLRAATKRGRPLLRIYSWEKPAISFGYFQGFPTNISDNRAVVRRPTGGGIVYHGDDTTYTVVVPPGHALFKMATIDAYGVLHKAVAAAFASQAALHEATLQSPRGQYECFQKPVRGDVVADGQKLAGGAQRRTKSGMLHQGSIAARVSAEQLKHAFEEVLAIRFVDYKLTDAEAALAEKLTVEKYATDAWNHRPGAGAQE